MWAVRSQNLCKAKWCRENELCRGKVCFDMGIELQLSVVKTRAIPNGILGPSTLKFSIREKSFLPMGKDSLSRKSSSFWTFKPHEMKLRCLLVSWELYRCCLMLKTFGIFMFKHRWRHYFKKSKYLEWLSSDQSGYFYEKIKITKCWFYY